MEEACRQAETQEPERVPAHTALAEAPEASSAKATVGEDEPPPEEGRLRGVPPIQRRI